MYVDCRYLGRLRASGGGNRAKGEREGRTAKDDGGRSGCAWGNTNGVKPFRNGETAARQWERNVGVTSRKDGKASSSERSHWSTLKAGKSYPTRSFVRSRIRGAHYWMMADDDMYGEKGKPNG